MLCIFKLDKNLFFYKISDPAYGTSCAPSVLIIFINMMLLKSSPDNPPCRAFMYDGQNELQRTFLALAFLCIPVMLLGKPVYKIMVARKRKVLYSLFTPPFTLKNVIKLLFFSFHREPR